MRWTPLFSLSCFLQIPRPRAKFTGPFFTVSLFLRLSSTQVCQILIIVTVFCRAATSILDTERAEQLLLCFVMEWHIWLCRVRHGPVGLKTEHLRELRQKHQQDIESGTSENLVIYHMQCVAFNWPIV